MMSDPATQRRNPKNDSALSSALFWAFLGLLTHWASSHFSVGFFHADEHFQILEFAYARLGHHPLQSATQMPLEYSEKIRPWLQPAFAAAIYQAIDILPHAWVSAASRPWLWAEILRTLSTLLGYLSVLALWMAAHTDEKLKKNSVQVLRFGAILWCLPAFHSRFSSESWSASFYALGFATLILSVSRPISSKVLHGLTGVFFGLAFEMRFQVAWMILGALLYLFFVAPPLSPLRSREFGLTSSGLRLGSRLRSLLPLGFGFGIIFLVGRGIDQWGYQTVTFDLAKGLNLENWVLTPWRYFDFNLLQNRVNSAGADPWWDYFRRSLTEAFPLLGIFLLSSLFLCWGIAPLSLLTFSTLPFVIFHFVIAHKELRFLFPLLGLAPWWLARLHRPSLGRRSFWRKSLLALNAIALLLTTLTPLAPSLAFLQKLETYLAENPKLTLWSVGNSNPYESGGVELWVYRPSGVRPAPLTPIQFLGCKSAPAPTLVLTSHLADLKSLQTQGWNCQRILSQYPGIFSDALSWIDRSGLGPRINAGNPLETRIRQWALNECSCQ
jgi:phosphatidylinositol glycan class B